MIYWADLNAVPWRLYFVQNKDNVVSRLFYYLNFPSGIFMIFQQKNDIKRVRTFFRSGDFISILILFERVNKTQWNPFHFSFKHFSESGISSQNCGKKMYCYNLQQEFMRFLKCFGQIQIIFKCTWFGIEMRWHLLGEHTHNAAKFVFERASVCMDAYAL